MLSLYLQLFNFILLYIKVMFFIPSFPFELNPIDSKALRP